MHEDFDIASLAAYLHLTPAQVTRMADRDRLPGRKIGGEWRFATAEIHHWLEERIGASDEEELVAVEGVLERASNDDASVSIADLLSLDAIRIPLPARTRNSVITSVVEAATSTGQLWDPEKMVEAVKSRENLHPTALDNGVALLHSRRPLPSILGEPIMALGRTQQGIPFGGARGAMTDVFFLICSVDDSGHLRTLARLSRLLANPQFLSDLRSAESPADAHAVVVAFEGELPA